jgi:putative integral membrane protein (TIGR02587 family)
MSAWRQEASDFVRALSGAFLFGTPLLFTMEMWELGVTVAPWRLLLFLLVALLASAGLAYSTGFRHQEGRPSAAKSLEEAVDAVAVGVVASVCVLLALNRISLGDPLGGAAGKVAVQTVPLALGASVANAVFARGGREGDQEDEGKKAPDDDGKGAQPQEGEGDSAGAAAKAAPGPWAATLLDIGATTVGAVFVCVSIVPTDEVPLLASGMTYWHEVALIALALAVSYGIVFASGFDPEGDERPGGIFQHPLSETAVAYTVSLTVSLAALVLFNRITPEEPLGFAISQTLVLAFPAAVGGAAGRLVA